jgi:hypothetical protein
MDGHKKRLLPSTGVKPTVGNYNASAVKIYNATKNKKL